MIMKAMKIGRTMNGLPCVIFVTTFISRENEKLIKQWLEDAGITGAVVGVRNVRFMNEEDAMLCLMSFA